MSTQDVRREITPADRAMAAYRALCSAASKVRITQGQRNTIIAQRFNAGTGCG